LESSHADISELIVAGSSFVSDYSPPIGSLVRSLLDCESSSHIDCAASIRVLEYPPHCENTRNSCCSE
jgi:hypothetical protein